LNFYHHLTFDRNPRRRALLRITACLLTLLFLSRVDPDKHRDKKGYLTTQIYILDLIDHEMADLPEPLYHPTIQVRSAAPILPVTNLNASTKAHHCGAHQALTTAMPSRSVSPPPSSSGPCSPPRSSVPCCPPPVLATGFCVALQLSHPGLRC
jgi:hypothetical protein